VRLTSLPSLQFEGLLVVGWNLLGWGGEIVQVEERLVGQKLKHGVGFFNWEGGWLEG